MDLEQIIELVDDAEASTTVTREEAAAMLVFGRISQWDDAIGADVQTEFRGTFDQIKPKRNRILAELWSNPIDITFKAKDGADPDSAETLSGMYRTDMLRSEEAVETAQQDQVDCGMGSFRYSTEYESDDDLNNQQRICAEPINESNNVVYWDSNCKKKDKSDARWCAILHTFSAKGWETYCSENGVEHEENPPPFKQPKNTDSWFWRSKQDEVKVAEFYWKEKKRERVFIFEDPIGQTKAVYQTDVKNILAELSEMGFIKIGEKMKERWLVHKWLVDGKSVLKKQRIPGQFIPVITAYGDWSRVEGREIWRGIYHDAQDAQRVHNYTMSYIADIVAKSPKEKPVFPAGMIQGQEQFWIQEGESLPYKLINEISPITQQPYAAGLIGTSPVPQVPQAAAALLELTRQSVNDVTGSTLDQEQMLNGQVTEGQIAAVQRVQNMETFLYQNSWALAMKHAGRVYASMAAEIYDVPREVTVTMPDGTEKQIMLMESVFDDESGQDVVMNDISKGKFEVYAEVGPSYQTQKDQARAELQALFTALAGTPEGNIILLTYLTLLEGPKMDHLRDYARKQLILQGIMEPDTDEEKAMVAQAQQQQSQPDPMTLAAMAEMEKAKADQMDAQTKQAQVQVSAYDAETKRVKAMAEVQKLKADTAKVSFEITGTELDNVQKLQTAMTPPSMRQATRH